MAEQHPLMNRATENANRAAGNVNRMMEEARKANAPVPQQAPLVIDCSNPIESIGRLECVGRPTPAQPKISLNEAVFGELDKTCKNPNTNKGREYNGCMHAIKDCGAALAKGTTYSDANQRYEAPEKVYRAYGQCTASKLESRSFVAK